MSAKSGCGSIGLPMMLAISMILPARGAAQPGNWADSLVAITARGRMLAAYDWAAWHATDAVMAESPATEEIQGYVALHRNDGWTVLFGRVSDEGGAFLVAYEATENSNWAHGFAVTRYSPAKRLTGTVAAAARAIDIARADFGTPTRNYNSAVLPAGNGEWFVYLIPAQTRAGVYPLGGDVRYRISADGTRILVKRRLHNVILEYSAPPPSAKGLPFARFHSAVLDDIPEDTDVFHVLVRDPKVPEYVLTDKFVYRINIDGSMGSPGRREDIVGPDGKIRVR